MAKWILTSLSAVALALMIGTLFYIFSRPVDEERIPEGCYRVRHVKIPQTKADLKMPVDTWAVERRIDPIPCSCAGGVVESQ